MQLKEYFKRNYLHFLVLTIVVLLFMLSTNKKAEIYQYTNENNFEKIIDAENVPIRVMDYLKEVDGKDELQRAIYFFSHFGREGEVCYVVFCGGSSYERAYDVEIVDIKDSIVKHVPGEVGMIDPVIIYYKFNIVESSKSLIEYNDRFSQPIVIFKTKKMISPMGEVVQDAVNQNGEVIRVRKRA